MRCGAQVGAGEGAGRYSQGLRHWGSSSWPTLRKSLPRGWGMEKMGRLWQEWGGSRSGGKPFGVESWALARHS